MVLPACTDQAKMTYHAIMIPFHHGSNSTIKLKMLNVAILSY